MTLGRDRESPEPQETEVPSHASVESVLDLRPLSPVPLIPRGHGGGSGRVLWQIPGVLAHSGQPGAQGARAGGELVGGRRRRGEPVGEGADRPGPSRRPLPRHILVAALAAGPEPYAAQPGSLARSHRVAGRGPCGGFERAGPAPKSARGGQAAEPARVRARRPKWS